MDQADAAGTIKWVARADQVSRAINKGGTADRNVRPLGGAGVLYFLEASHDR